VPFASRRLLAFVLLSLLLSACIADTSQPTPTATGVTGATGGASASPQPGVILTPPAGVAADIATARQLEGQGDFEDAVGVYVAVAAARPDDRTEASLSAARLLLELERPEDARLLLEAFLARPNLSGDDLAAHYLLARAYAALERWDESLQQYDLYIQSGRAALPYAYLDRSKVLLALNRPADAAQSAQAGLALGVPSTEKRAYVLATAQAYERAGSLDDAITWYQKLLDESGLSGDESLALSRIAAVKQVKGDPSYKDDLTNLMSNYPASSEAMGALQDALGSGETVLPSIQGLIYYRHNDYTTAEPQFQKQIDDAPNDPASALAYYYRGAVRESRGELDDAMSDYARVVELDPKSPLADDALWWRARILENDAHYDDAGSVYQRIVNEYPNSSFAADASFRRGLLAYRAGNYTNAASIWAQDLTSATDDATRQHLSLWQAKALQMAGSQSGAKPILDNLASKHEDDYPGIRALGLSGGQQNQPHAAVESSIDLAPKFDWTAAETWLAQKTGRPATDKVWLNDNRWSRAQELWRVGRSSYADLEVYDIIESDGGDPIAMYTLSRELLNEGRVSMSGRAGQRLLRVLDTTPTAGLPKAILSLSYPAAFGTMVQQYADAAKVSPLLLLAFMRQESFFDPRAVSPAGALGLTQLLPDTANSLANALNLQGVDDDTLLHAGLNLQLGAKYMADQLSRFSNELFVALAAYNAGPNAASRWRDAAGADADLYLETVEFSETRLYIQTVSENYAIYRYLYAGEKQPDLPK
jgi:soluble lytic murein transglycosylase-like protein